MSKNKAKTTSAAVAAPAKNTEPQAPAKLVEETREAVALLLGLLSSAVPIPPGVDAAERKRLESAVFGLLNAVNPQDGLEYIAAAQLAALNLASLDSLARAAKCGSDSRARDPEPRGKRGALVALPTQTSLKVELYRLLKRENVTRAELMRRLNWKRESVDRLFRLDHATRLEQFDAAFRALGRKVEISVH